MSPQAENILNRRITGLTWGFALSILGVFGSGGVFIVHHLVRIELSMARSAEYGEAIKAVNTRVDVVDKRIDNQEGRIFDLVTEMRNNKNR